MFVSYFITPRHGDSQVPAFGGHEPFDDVVFPSAQGLTTILAVELGVEDLEIRASRASRGQGQRV